MFWFVSLNASSHPVLDSFIFLIIILFYFILYTLYYPFRGNWVFVRVLPDVPVHILGDPQTECSAEERYYNNNNMTCSVDPLPIPPAKDWCTIAVEFASTDVAAAYLHIYILTLSSTDSPNAG